MGTSSDLEVLGQLRVARDRSVMSPVHPDDLGQQMRIRRVRLRPRGRMAFPVAGHLQRVDRIHQVAGRQQGLDPRSAFSLNPTIT
jgi:hypothetical protein